MKKEKELLAKKIKMKMKDSNNLYFSRCAYHPNFFRGNPTKLAPL
jgi:hypothetical protein